LIVPEFIQSRFNVSVLLAETTQLGKLFYIMTTLTEKLYFRKSYGIFDGVA